MNQLPRNCFNRSVNRMIAVHPCYQRNGIGKKLLASIIANEVAIAIRLSAMSSTSCLTTTVDKATTRRKRRSLLPAQTFPQFWIGMVWIGAISWMKSCFRFSNSLHRPSVLTDWITSFET